MTLELRDKRKEIENDRTNICFICNLERYLFDKYSDGFENHTKRDHNLWNYLYFLYGLKKKGSTECSGLESFVVKEIFTESKDWVPLGKALCLKATGEKESMLENRVQTIEAEIEQIEELLQG